MYGPTDLKKGRVIVVDGKPYQVVEYQQKVMGRGGSIVNVRIKNLIDGSVLAKTYKGQEKIEAAEVSNQTAQYLYSDGEKVYFMNPTTFEQFELPLEDAEDVPKYMREGERLSGDLFISVDSVRENAVEYGTEFADELNRVMVHGLLHLIGYDDHTEEDVKTMREKENQYLEIRSHIL